MFFFQTSTSKILILGVVRILRSSSLTSEIGFYGNKNIQTVCIIGGGPAGIGAGIA